MKRQRVLIQREKARVIAPSLEAYLNASLIAEHRMDGARMKPIDRATCRWIGFGIGKGVTHPEENVSVFGVPRELVSGLHGELIQGLGVSVDPTPACYEPNAPYGFNGFIRWVLFADPSGAHNILGIDFSLMLSRRRGVASSMLEVSETAGTLRAHGVPGTTELALLNANMCEPEELATWRVHERLITLDDWVAHRPYLLPGGGSCPRCGLRTLTNAAASFCSRCGCKPSRIWQRHHSH